ncbi:MAG TPA: exodeoxyribonuclease V subunit gamma [Spirochaetota bacterium]|nr:exodeoxyribonuclease V subunit gamma [Spirochaetota bacterium]
MPGLYLVSGNRLELLAERCASLFRDEPLPPMTKEIIVLQSMGMMQWLSIQLAGKLGIWADFEYVLPNRMTSILMKHFFPGMGDERFFEKDIMTWKTMKVLRDSTGSADYSKLHAYISGDDSGMKEFQLASRITDLFDQYMTFRPDMILRWGKGESGEADEWQPLLWRELTEGMNGHHPPMLLDMLFSGITGGSISRPSGFPERISVFGISYLPLYHLNVLRAASNFCDVFLYMLNPCKEYWIYTMSEKEITRYISRVPIIADNYEEELHIERGNPMLSSMGRAGRDFFRFIDMSVGFSPDEELLIDPGNDSILHVIQGDIFRMKRRGEGRELPAFILTDKQAESDLSVVINSCHSVMREVEVLHDYLLDLFDNGSGVTPGDVLVMTPDIESFSSIIQGVFDRREDGLPRIPYRIVDRRIGNTSRAVDTFMKIMSLPEGRVTSSEVMGILQCPDVLRKFSLSGDDYDSICGWVMDTAVYWGIDAEHKGELGLPEIYDNTWRFGLERMLLGSVMGCSDVTPLGILPYREIEGANMQVLGRFISYFRLLSDTYYELREKHTPDGWGLLINRIIETFFEPDQVSSDDLLQVTAAAARLREIETASGFSSTAGLSPVREFIEQKLSAASAGRNFITGNLTFCEMLPMRSIPCKVICLIGMNEYSFPRKARPSGFDLMMKFPRTGDRSVRDEDRYLFLETVISARDRLYISYTGQNITTNTDQNPSIVVSELLEVIDESFSIKSGKRIRDSVFRKQKIQSYNPVYFTRGTGYFSYSRGRMDGAHSYIKKGGAEYTFLQGGLPGLTEDERVLTVDDLAGFLVNPAKYLIKRRLNVSLEYFTDDFRDDEPFIPDTLERYNLEERILASLEKDMSEESAFDYIRKEGILPHGESGRIVYRESYSRIKKIYDIVSPLLVNKSMEESLIEINGYKIKLRNPVYDGRFIFYRGGRLRPKDRLLGWVYHLAACATGRYSDKFCTMFFASGENIKYRFADNSRTVLETLISIYESGMTEAVPLFPGSSYEYAVQVSSKDPESALKSAAGKFRNTGTVCDLNDPYIARIFGESYRLSEEFIDLADKVYSPMIEHEEGGE